MWCCPRRIPTISGGLDPRTLPVFRPKATKGRVVKVIDGDSVWVAVREHGQLVRLSVRLQGIDTPELRSKCSAERLLAQRAKEELAALWGGSSAGGYSVSWRPVLRSSLPPRTRSSTGRYGKWRSANRARWRPSEATRPGALAAG